MKKLKLFDMGNPTSLSNGTKLLILDSQGLNKNDDIKCLY